MTVKTPIYLDYAATTPLDPRVVKAMMACLDLQGDFANPASTSHIHGERAKQKVAMAQGQIAQAIHAQPSEIVWTSGATESDNLAIKGAAQFHQKRGKHIITSAIEHKAVLDTCGFLTTEGFDITYLEPDGQGFIHPQQVRDALRDDTILVSIMHANNETGAIQPIQAIAEITREQGVLLHVDAAQSLGKIAINLATLPVDLMSFASHKVYGPKGIGVLYVRHKPRARLLPQIHGGGHQQGLRSGTLPTHQIVGMGEAVAMTCEDLPKEYKRLQQMRDKLWQGIKHLPAIVRNSPETNCLPGHLNVSFPTIEGEALLMGLDKLAISSGSACTSATIEPSHVLLSMGKQPWVAYSTVRFSLGRFTKDNDVNFIIQHVCDVVTRLDAISPLTPEDVLA